MEIFEQKQNAVRADGDLLCIVENAELTFVSTPDLRVVEMVTTLSLSPLAVSAVLEVGRSGWTSHILHVDWEVVSVPEDIFNYILCSILE